MIRQDILEVRRGRCESSLTSTFRNADNVRRAYNDMLYLCERFGPSDALERYNPEKDIAVTGTHIPFVINQLK